MPFSRQCGFLVCLSFIVACFSGTAYGATGAASDVVVSKSLDGLLGRVWPAMERMTGQSMRVRSLPTSETIDVFCGGQAAIMVIDRPFTSEDTVGCGAKSVTELRLGTYALDPTLLTAQQRQSAEGIAAMTERAVVMYIDRNQAEAYKAILTTITDDSWIGSNSALADQGLMPLPDNERDATRKAASDLPVFTTATPPSAKMTADAHMETQNGGANSADPRPSSDNQRTAQNAGNFSDFDPKLWDRSRASRVLCPVQWPSS